MNELQKEDLNILLWLTDYCDTHGIRYHLDSGTLLGAVRHKGYIPWDDDIDIAMTRDVYDRFEKEILLVLDSNHQYRFQSRLKDKYYIH